ncbi:MAG: hypothetical protein ACKOFI_12825, partial [Phycisphaerales bacterium]
MATGRIVRQARLPKVEAIRFGADLTMVVASADGRVQRLETLARSAAKNHASVAVVTDPAQYDAVAGELRA